MSGKKTVADMVLESAQETIATMLDEHRADLEQALTLCGNEVSISISVKTTQTENGIEMAAKVGFTKEKVESKRHWLISANEELFAAEGDHV